MVSADFSVLHGRFLSRAESFTTCARHEGSHTAYYDANSFGFLNTGPLEGRPSLVFDSST